MTAKAKYENVIFVRISRHAKRIIGYSRKANAILERLIRLHKNDIEKRNALVNDPRLRDCEEIVNEDGRSRLIIDRGTRYTALALTYGNTKMLKALILLVTLYYMPEVSKRLNKR